MGDNERSGPLSRHNLASMSFKRSLLRGTESGSTWRIRLYALQENLQLQREMSKTRNTGNEDALIFCARFII